MLSTPTSLQKKTPQTDSTPTRFTRNKEQYSASILPIQNFSLHRNSNSKLYSDFSSSNSKVLEETIANLFDRTSSSGKLPFQVSHANLKNIAQYIGSRQNKEISVSIDQRKSSDMNRKMLLKERQFPEQVVKLYEEAKNKKGGFVNFTQGYLQKVGYLYFSVEKSLVLVNPNLSLFPQLSSTPLQMTLSDVLIRIYQTQIKVKINIEEKQIIGKIVIMVHPWLVELYVLLTNQKINPFYKLYVKQKLNIERVVDLVTTENGMMYYLGDGSEIHQLNLKSLKTTSTRFTIMGSIAAQRDHKKINLWYKKIVDKFNFLLNGKLFKGLGEKRQGKKIKIYNNYIFVLFFFFNHRIKAKQSEIICYSLEGEELDEKVRVTSTEISKKLNIQQKNLYDFGFSSNEKLIILLQSGQLIKWNYCSNTLSFVLDLSLNKIITSKISKDQIQIITDKPELLLVDKNYEKTELAIKEVSKVENYLYQNKSSQKIPDYYIYSTDSLYNEVIKLRDIDIIHQIICSSDGLFDIIDNEKLILTIKRQTNLSNKMILLKTMNILCSEAATMFFNFAENQLIIEYLTDLEKEKFQKFFQRSLECFTEEILQQFIESNRTLQFEKNPSSFDYAYVVIVEDYLRQIFQPVWHQKVNDKNPLILLLKKIQLLESVLNSAIVKDYYEPFLNKMKEYITLLRYLPKTSSKFGQGFGFAPEEYQSDLLEVYLQQYNENLLKTYKVVFPEYLSEKFVELCSIHKEILPLDKFKSIALLKKHEPNYYPDCLIEYLRLGKMISRSELKE